MLLRCYHILPTMAGLIYIYKKIYKRLFQHLKTRIPIFLFNFLYHKGYLNFKKFYFFSQKTEIFLFVQNASRNLLIEVSRIYVKHLQIIITFDGPDYLLYTHFNAPMNNFITPSFSETQISRHALAIKTVLGHFSEKCF